MEIEEQFIKGKRTDQSKCEDGYIIKPRLVAVVDGVTAKGEHLWDGGYTSGRTAKERIIQFLSGDVESMDAQELFSALSYMLMEEYKRELNDDIPCERLKACIAVYNDVYREIWTYGDCQIMINGTLYDDSRKLEKELSLKRAQIINDALENGMTEDDISKRDIGREYIMDDLKKVSMYENKLCDMGFPVLNGTEIIPSMIKKYPVSPGAEVVMATDGYPCLKNTLEESESELKRIIKEDPLCIRDFISTKGIEKGNESFDDRTYIRFTATNNEDKYKGE